MSETLIDHVWKVSCNPDQKVVLLALATYMDTDVFVWIDTLPGWVAWRTGIPISNALLALAHLKQEGFIVEEEGANRVRLNVEYIKGLVS